MKDFFNVSDLAEFCTNDGMITPYKAVEILNKKLNALIESWPVVYNKNNGIGTMPYAWSKVPLPNKDDTHRARLAFIEELPKEPCKHEPEPKLYATGQGWVEAMVPRDLKCICRICKVELVAEWKPK